MSSNCFSLYTRYETVTPIPNRINLFITAVGTPNILDASNIES